MSEYLFMFQLLQKQPAAQRLSGPASSSCSFRVKFSQTLDFLLQTSHSNTLASPPHFFPQVNVINSAVCSVDWPSSSQTECLCPPLLSHLFTPSPSVCFALFQLNLFTFFFSSSPIPSEAFHGISLLVLVPDDAESVDELILTSLSACVV